MKKLIILSLLLYSFQSSATAFGPFIPAGGTPAGTTCALAGCTMTGDIQFPAAKGICVDGDAQQCLVGDSAGGWAFNDELGNDIFTVTTAGLVTATGDITSSTATGSFLLELSAGSAATPTYGFTGDAGEGLFRVSSNIVGIASQGVEQVRISNAIGLQMIGSGGSTAGSGTLQNTGFNASTPAFSFATDLNTGIFWVGADEIGFSAGGTQRVSIDATDILTTVGLTFSSVTTDITSGANEDIAINPNGTGDLTTDGEVVFSPGTVASGVTPFSLTYTMSDGAANQIAANWQVTSGAGSSATSIRGLNINMISGATPSTRTAPIVVLNQIAGTGTTPMSGTANYGFFSQVTSAGSGHSAGGFFDGAGSTNANYGSISRVSTTASTNAAGMVGFASAGTNKVGAIAQINSGVEEPLNGGALTSAGMIASNGDVSAPIAIFMDDATPAAQFVDGGELALRQGTLAMTSGTARVGGMIETNVTANGNVGAGTDQLLAFDILSPTLSSDMQSFSFRAWGTFAANANNKTLAVDLAGNTLLSTGALAFNNADWVINGTCMRVSNTAADCITTVTTSSALLTTTADFVAVTGLNFSTTTATLKLTGSATSDNDIVQEGWWVRWDPAN